MIPLTFLAAKMPLVKHFGIKDTRNYPLARDFTSIHHEVEPTNKGLATFHELLVANSQASHCLYKGELIRPLIQESRAGLTKTTDDTQLVVIDVDKYSVETPLPRTLDREELRRLSEMLIHQLPPEFQDVSYIVQASASMGVRPSKVSLHLFFFLDKPVPPQMLKWWLTRLNFRCMATKERLCLSPTGRSLDLVIDKCMAENSRIVYIAPPTFDGINDPFAGKPEERIALVEKERAQLPCGREISEITPQLVQYDYDAHLNQLRKNRGLDTRPAKTKMVQTGQHTRNEVLQNPDRAIIQYAYHNDVFCYANLNNGDSNAYYWPLNNPKWVHNFKDEPVFEMAKVDPDFFKWFTEEFQAVVNNEVGYKPLVFRDFVTDAYYTIEYDPRTEKLHRFATAARASLKDFCEQYWEPVPDPIPTWDIFFDPQGNPGLHWEAQALNLFNPTHYMTGEEFIDDEFKGIEYGFARDPLYRLTPNIYKLIDHMLGNGAREMEHFINWFAFAFQYRTKSNIAWLLHGVEGTGKGMFYLRVIKRLFGQNYTAMKRINDLEDNFDGWREHNLMTVVDEFRLADATSSSRLYDHIKNMISEPFGTVRHMRSNPKEVPLYTNYLFFSNNEDAMKMSASDRRFCLGLRQTIKIDMVYDMQTLLDGVDEELSFFATFLNHFAVDENQARVALENQAKTDMRLASNSWVDDFCSALNYGNFDFFLESVLSFTPTEPEDVLLQNKCKEIIAGWLMQYLESGENQVTVGQEECRIIYSFLADKTVRPNEFGKLLSRRGITPPRYRFYGRQGRWMQVVFDFSDLDPMDMISEYGNPNQKERLQEFAPRRRH